jgi:hypothetical protein
LRCYDFNQSIDNLSKTLTNLTFGYYFNKSMDNLPLNTKYLSIHCVSKIINNLPQHIEELVIKTHFSICDIENLPYSLKKITISKRHLPFLIKIPFGVIVDLMNNNYL